MTAAARKEPAAQTGCWCCGNAFAENELVRLGEHPEVGLCLGCATWVKRRAFARHHERHPSVAGQVRGGLEVVRNAVIERGWHDRGRLGTVLRWIDRHLP